jgi:hypothetical protein
MNTRLMVFRIRGRRIGAANNTLRFPALTIDSRMTGCGRLLLLATLKFTPVVWLLLAESSYTRR